MVSSPFVAFDFRVAHPGTSWGGPVVKNPPCNAAGVGLIPGWGAETLPATEQPSP